MHTWKTRIAATLAVLMLTNCISPAAFAQNTEESPQSTQVSLLSDENNADFTIEDGVLTAYTGKVGGQAVLGRQPTQTTPWLTERHGYDPT